MTAMQKLYLVIPLAPLVGAVIAGLFGWAIGRRAAHWITILGMVVCTAGAILVFQDVLAGSGGRIVTRDEILDAVWGPDYVPGSNVVDRHIRDVRAKLGFAKPVTDLDCIADDMVVREDGGLRLPGCSAGFLEGGDVVRLAAGDDAIVADDLRIEPISAGIFDVALNCRP